MRCYDVLLLLKIVIKLVGIFGGVILVLFVGRSVWGGIYVLFLLINLLVSVSRL